MHDYIFASEIHLYGSLTALCSAVALVCFVIYLRFMRRDKAGKETLLSVRSAAWVRFCALAAAVFGGVFLLLLLFSVI